MARVRKARALADIGDRTRALSELDAAWVALEDSIGLRDPSWTWWINELELAGHEGEALLTGGDADAALTGLQRARELSADFVPGGRGALYYTVSILTAYARAGDWPECEATLISLPTMLEVVSSGRNRHRLRTTLREIDRTAEAPSWLKDLARDMASMPQLAAV